MLQELARWAIAAAILAASSLVMAHLIVHGIKTKRWGFIHAAQALIVPVTLVVIRIVA